MDVRKVGDGRGGPHRERARSASRKPWSRAALTAALAFALAAALAPALGLGGCGGHRGESEERSAATGEAPAASKRLAFDEDDPAAAPDAPKAKGTKAAPGEAPAGPAAAVNAAAVNAAAAPTSAAASASSSSPPAAPSSPAAAAAPASSPAAAPPASPAAAASSSTPAASAAPRAPSASRSDGATFPADCSVTAPSPAQHDILWASPADGEPEQLDGVNETKIGQHYYVSDEGHADRFREHIADSGGGYVGIGSDQAYLYIGWARPQFAWTVDYDPHIVWLHQIQQAFLLAAESPAAYLALWQRESNAQARAIVEALTENRQERRRLLKVLSAAQPRIRKRMERLARNLRETPSYLSDQGIYDFVRNLVRHGCVRPMLVNLLDKNGLRGITRAATKVGIPIRTLYLSNAEEYWEYTDQFRANIRGLPRDARSRVLHTISSSDNEDYIYVAQPLDNFVAWLDARWAKRSRTMIGRIRVEGMTHFPSVFFDKDPTVALAERRARRKAKRRAANDHVDPKMSPVPVEAAP